MLRRLWLLISIPVVSAVRSAAAHQSECGNFVSVWVNTTNTKCTMNCIEPIGCISEAVNYTDLSVKGTCFGHWVHGFSEGAPHLIMKSAASPHLCQALCQGEKDCVWFHWSPSTGLDKLNCQLLTLQEVVDYRSGACCTHQCSGVYKCSPCSPLGCVWHSDKHITGPKVCIENVDLVKDFCRYDPNTQPHRPLPFDEKTTTSSSSSSSTTTTTTFITWDHTVVEKHNRVPPALAGAVIGAGCLIFITGTTIVLTRGRPEPRDSVDPEGGHWDGVEPSSPLP